ncbi:cation:proton antiporter domain-containing protein [Streptomonospora litoralis]|uniref:Glutathione-regulated potassium-efflux system protein KefC n=1 Tax=Streptomonospora litoralis TaxID=2498135 RepID=A0A4V0ZJ17_9ACTN|nr:cation:proton antiporter [Streptomonospora litoralis]QBI51922.1 Glutathione-regulated potassium-efflux system protein KefC [Streptomonospora litoralis]
MLLAAEETPAYLPPVVLLLCAAAVIGYLSVRVRVVPIVGFLLAGVVIGPHQLGLVGTTETVEAAADIGIILLLFTIGIEFSLERLASIKRHVLVGGGLQVLLTTGIVAALVMAFGAGWQVAVFTGFLVALSSTAIVLKVLAAAGRTTAPLGQAGVATLIFQDLAVVLMVLIVPLLGGGSGEGPLEIAGALGTAAAVLVVVLVVARKVMPPLLERVARACSPEVFLLTVVAIGMGTAYLTSLAGVSVALGAFLAGLVVSESRHSAHALGEVLPLQILFSATFFVSIGMLLDLRALMELWWLVLLLALAVVVIKAVTAALALSVLGVGTSTAVAGGLLLAQIGEFSFVLQRSGAEAGLEPAGLGADGEQVLIAVTVLLMTATPALAALGDRLGRWAGSRRRSRPGAPAAPGGGEAAEGRAGAEAPVLISGWGAVAAELAAAVRARGVPVTVTTLGPDLAAAAEAEGHTVVRGDPVRHNVLEEAGLFAARAVVVAENTGEESAHIAAVIGQLVPGVPIVVRPVDAAEPDVLAPSGARRIVDTPRTVADGLTAALMTELGLPSAAPGDRPDPHVPVDFSADPQTPCPHTGWIRPVLPTSAGCTDCLRKGERDWIHLRICLTCGHVGCCDSSPDRHASAHAAAADHPLVTSAEPGEDWAWCYLDGTQVARKE